MNNPRLVDALKDTPELVRDSPLFQHGTDAIKDDSGNEIQFTDDGGVCEGVYVNPLWFKVLGVIAVVILFVSLALLIAERTMGVHLGGIR